MPAPLRLALPLGLCAALLAPLAAGAQSRPATPEPTPVSRYSMVSYGTNGVMLLDSVTGRSWRLTIQRDKPVWEPIEYWQPFKPLHLPPSTSGAPTGAPEPPAAPPTPAPTPPPAPARR